ncbi:MAG: hypothetical protein R2838_04780 [Caldilineaceae bacterium]
MVRRLNRRTPAFRRLCRFPAHRAHPRRRVDAAPRHLTVRTYPYYINYYNPLLGGKLPPPCARSSTAGARGWNRWGHGSTSSPEPRNCTPSPGTRTALVRV